MPKKKGRQPLLGQISSLYFRLLGFIAPGSLYKNQNFLSTLCFVVYNSPMSTRNLHPHPYKHLASVLPANYQVHPDAFIIPGQAAGIRFFDQDSREDFQAILDIAKGKESRKWMDHIARLTWSDYQEWAGRHTFESFLFSVHDMRLNKPKDRQYIRGFVNIYSERSEKFRIKRMEKLGFLKPDKKGTRHVLEVSFAVRPFKQGAQSGSGLMSSALRQSCLQVRSLLNYPKHTDLKIFAFIDPDNLPSKYTLEAAGFVKKGQMTYDSTTTDKSTLYILNWSRLHQKVKGKLLELYNTPQK
jgi:hypothetical protein